MFLEVGREEVEGGGRGAREDGDRGYRAQNTNVFLLSERNSSSPLASAC